MHKAERATQANFPAYHGSENWSYVARRRKHTNKCSPKRIAGQRHIVARVYLLRPTCATRPMARCITLRHPGRAAATSAAPQRKDPGQYSARRSKQGGGARRITRGAPTRAAASRRDRSGRRRPSGQDSPRSPRRRAWRAPPSTPARRPRRACWSGLVPWALRTAPAH